MDLPADLKPGDYGVVRTTGFVPWCIRLLTRSAYDHVFIVIGADGNGDYDIVEAEPAGARYAKLSEYEGYDMLFNTGEPLTDAQRDAIVAEAHRLVGTPYGFLDIVRLGLMLTIRRAPKWLTKRADAEQAIICSQLVAMCGRAAGVDWLCGQSTPAMVTPGMLATRIATQGWTRHALELARLDRLQDALRSSAIDGDARAVETSLRIIDRRSRLLGLTAAAAA
jgi:hypothetical protein